MSDAWLHHRHLPGADAGSTINIEGDEAAHAIRSLRLHPGETLTLFNGAGATALAEIVEIGPRRKSISLLVRDTESQPTPRPRVHLFCALPKGDRQSTLLNMATQIGMTEFTPLTCERGVVSAGRSSAERWRRIVIEACKQSRRAWLPVINAEASFEKALEGGSPQTVGFIAHPDGRPLLRLLADVEDSFEEFRLFVGPEGGFTDDEILQAESKGFRRTSLGPHILRVETAAAVMTAMAINILICAR